MNAATGSASASASASASWCDGAAELGADERSSLGTMLVVAPHADDESLGCGGLIALLADAGHTVWIVLMSDGTGSHPGSRAFDAEARRDLREGELVDAAAHLGVPAARVLPMRLLDGAVPAPEDAGFASSADVLRALVETTGATSLLVPWRRDPHPDHRAASALARHAVERTAGERPRLLEYMVWTSERGTPDDLPRRGEAQAWCVDIRTVRERKRQAIAAHRSQAGLVITDDPHGFTLSSEMRERAAAPTEYFLEAH